MSGRAPSKFVVFVEDESVLAAINDVRKECDADFPLWRPHIVLAAASLNGPTGGNAAKQIAQVLRFTAPFPVELQRVCMSAGPDTHKTLIGLTAGSSAFDAMLAGITGVLQSTPGAAPVAPVVKQVVVAQFPLPALRSRVAFQAASKDQLVAKVRTHCTRALKFPVSMIVKEVCVVEEQQRRATGPAVVVTHRFRLGKPDAAVTRTREMTRAAKPSAELMATLAVPFAIHTTEEWLGRLQPEKRPKSVASLVTALRTICIVRVQFDPDIVLAQLMLRGALCNKSVFVPTPAPAAPVSGRGGRGRGGRGRGRGGRGSGRGGATASRGRPAGVSVAGYEIRKRTVISLTRKATQPAVGDDYADPAVVERRVMYWLRRFSGPAAAGDSNPDANVVLKAASFRKLLEDVVRVRVTVRPEAVLADLIARKVVVAQPDGTVTYA